MKQPAYDPNNVFAKILRGELPVHKVYEDDETFVLMDIMPRSDGHILVIPKAPCRNLYDAPPDAVAAVARTVQRVAFAVTSAFAADGVTVTQANESAGGQVVFHMHTHVMPRHDGQSLRPHTRQMADNAVLAAHAEKDQGGARLKHHLPSPLPVRRFRATTPPASARSTQRAGQAARSCGGSTGPTARRPAHRDAPRAAKPPARLSGR